VKGTRIVLRREWVLRDQIDQGGFGKVFAATSGDEEAVVKLVPKAPGADRELLFADLDKVRNVVPIIDSGEHQDYWVLVMPRAEVSLRKHIEASGGSLPLDEVIQVAMDIVEALVDLDGRVVHRDLKPENVLRLKGHWCLADFGISRYAEASTAPDTQKFALSPPYAAPERWKNIRATSAADVYATGVTIYEMLAGQLPFPGPSLEQFRDQHLHAAAPHLSNVPAALEALVDECLFKASEARPSPANVRARLDRVMTPANAPGLAHLQEAKRAQVSRMGEASRKQSAAETEAERRSALAKAAGQSFTGLSGALDTAISNAAPAAIPSPGRSGSLSLQLNHATLEISSIKQYAGGWEGRPIVIDVICFASISLKMPTDEYGYEGRSHSLWFGNIQDAGRYGWYETAFMVSPLLPRSSPQNPFSLDPGAEAAGAIGPGMAGHQVAWPFTPLVVGDLNEFIGRWAGWFAAAAQGQLHAPSLMPERSPDGSWRRS
jgi:eukaryotic-like serine/threonine-protein kinase